MLPINSDPGFGVYDSRMDRMKTVLRQTSRLTLLVCAALFAFAPSARAQLTINSGPSLGTWSIGMVDGVSLAATGGTPPYTWTVVALPPVDVGVGPLPQGLSIRTDIASYQQSFVPTPSAEIAGVALTAGSYNFTLRVTDSLGAQSTPKNVTMVISNLLLKDGFNLPDGRVNIPYSQQLHAIRKNGLNADPVSPRRGRWAASIPPAPMAVAQQFDGRALRHAAGVGLLHRPDHRSPRAARPSLET